MVKRIDMSRNMCIITDIGRVMKDDWYRKTDKITTCFA